VDLSRQTHGSELSGSLTDLLGLETLMGALITVESASKAGCCYGAGRRLILAMAISVLIIETNSLAAAEKRRFEDLL
jgi:hypothetical protein